MKDFFGDGLVEEVRAKTDIVDVVSDYVALKSSGANYKAKCPFHTERTPSFTVSREKQLFYCFGCGAGGDVLKFVMKIENIGFPEALRTLAERAGVSIPEKGGYGVKEGACERALAGKVIKVAVAYFRYILCKTQEGKKGREYLKTREINEAMVSRFELGYALPSWNGLITGLARKGIGSESLVKAGLIIPRKSGEGHYDRFRDRVMFPIFDLQGKPIGFGGRALDDSIPKYLNSPETPLFSKGRNLYGMNLAKDKIRAAGKAVIVEGYMDTITAHQHGIETVVASLGTAFTADQARMLARYTEEVVIAYDADAAGAAATLRGMDLLVANGLRVKVAVLPSGHDPDSFIREKGPKAFIDLVESGLSLAEYKLQVAVSGCDLSTLEGRVRAIGSVVNVLASMSNAVERSEYCKKVAEQLGVSEEAVLSEIRKRVSSGRRPRRQDKLLENTHTNASESSAEHLLRAMSRDTEMARRILKELGLEAFIRPEHRRIAKAISDLVNEGSDEDINEGVKVSGGFSSALVTRVLSRLEMGEEGSKAAEVATRIFMKGSEFSDMPDEKAVSNAIASVKRGRLEARLGELTREIEVSFAGGDTARFRELSSEWHELQARLRQEYGSFQGLHHT